MVKVKDIVALIEKTAPLQLQEDYDNAGYQVGDPEAEVTRVVACLDVTEKTVEHAMALGAQLIVSHHPLLFRPMKKITPDTYIGRTIIAAIRAGVTIYAAHTNLDNAYNGVNYRIAQILGLLNVKPLAALPANKLEGIENAKLCGSGVTGSLPSPISAQEFIAHVKQVFKCECLRNNFDSLDNQEHKIKHVAVCGGSGADFIDDAERLKADAFLTGEIGYHRFFGHNGILLVEAGHFETEQYTRNLFKELIEAAFPAINVEIIK